jgi:hypothetical protein
MEEPKPYDQTKEYFVGDRVTYPAASSYGTYDAPWVYVCIRYHPANKLNANPNVLYSPWPGEDGWDERWYGGYHRNYGHTDESQYWEPIVPEWVEGKTYFDTALVQYKGRIYQASWRYSRMWVPDGTIEDLGQPTEGGRYYEREPTLLPPNQDVDQDDIRTWMIISGSQTGNAPFCFAPYNFERDGDNWKTQKISVAPYSYFQNRGDNGFYNGGWRSGMNSGGKNQDGASLEVFQDYEPINFPDPENQYLGIYNMPGGPTSAELCGFAFQSQYIGDITYRAEIATFNEEAWPPQIRYQFTATIGATSASPDYDPGPPRVGSPSYPAQPSWWGKGRVFACHNHPLFHKRNIQVKGLVTETRSWWYKLPPYPGSPPSYGRKTKITKKIRTGNHMFVIGSQVIYGGSACLFDVAEYDPELFTEVGKFTLTAQTDTSIGLASGRPVYKVSP